MERRSLDGAVAMTKTTEEGRTLLGAAVAAFDALPSEAERSLAGRLSQELAEGTAHARVRAASSLADVAGIHAAPLLAWAVDDADPDLRVALADALGRTGGEAAIAAVDSLCRDEHPMVRAAAVDAAARLLEGDPEALRRMFREAVDDPDPRVRRRAALQAASTRGIDPGEILAKVLEDDDRHARRLAAVALGSTRRKDAALALVDALLDEDDSVRGAATGSATLLFGAEAERIAGLEPLRRGRAVARLRAHVAANASLPDSPDAWRADDRFAAVTAPVESDRAPVEHEPAPLADGHRGESVDCSENDRAFNAGDVEHEHARLDDGHGGSSDYKECGPAFGSSDDDSEPKSMAASFLPLVDTELAARLDHELDEDVLAVMHALSLARSTAEREATERSRSAVSTLVDAFANADSDAGTEVGGQEVGGVWDPTAAADEGGRDGFSEWSADSLVGADDDDAAAADEGGRDGFCEWSADSLVNAADADDANDGGDDNDADYANDANDANDADDADDANDANDVGAASAASAATAAAAAAAVEAGAGASPGFESIEAVLRAALRGATPDDLASELGLSALALGPVLEEHLDAGRIVRRGKKLFLP